MKLTPAQVQYQQAHADDTLVPSVLAATIIGLIVSYAAVGLRCYARQKSRMTFGTDDWLIIASVLVLTPYSICMWVNVAHGFGRHTIFVTHYRTTAISRVALRVSYSAANCLTHISILCFYNRLFRSKNLVYVSWFLGVFTVMYDFALILVSSLNCVPFAAMYSSVPGKCFDEKLPCLILGIVNVIADFAILTIPVRYVARLQMTTLRKLQICGIFMTGALVCVFGITRCTALTRINPADPSYDLAWGGIWSLLEGSIGIVAACLPVMGIFFTNLRFSATTESWMRKLRSSVSSRRSSRHSDSTFSRNSLDQKLQSSRQSLEFTEKPPVPTHIKTSPTGSQQSM